MAALINVSKLQYPTYLERYKGLSAYLYRDFRCSGPDEPTLSLPTQPPSDTFNMRLDYSNHHSIGVATWPTGTPPNIYDTTANA